MRGLRALVSGWWRRWVADPPAYRTVFVEELPERPRPACAYVAGEGPYRWFVAMLCPCGCREVLFMSLLPEGRPRWSLTEHEDGTISLHPSVWRQQGCRSHFFLSRGSIRGCEPTRAEPQQRSFRCVRTVRQTISRWLGP